MPSRFAAAPAWARASDAAFLKAFESGTLPPEAWTHEAHVRLGWILLGRFPREDAIGRVRSGIRRYNANVLGRPEAYHDTLTVAYLRIIAARRMPGQDWAVFRAGNPDLFDHRQPVTARHYSAELMASREAREGVVEPDLEPLP